MATISRETSARLHELAALLTEWNRTVNLVAPSTLPHLWSRHIEDSLTLAPWLAGETEAADLGSGAGFPGLVLSIAHDIHYVLIEADMRKASFLREAIRVTRAPATVHVGRVEAYTARTFPLVTARAFAPLDILLATSRHLLAAQGRYLLLKGRSAAAEIRQVEHISDLSILRHDVAGHPESAILEARWAP